MDIKDFRDKEKRELNRKAQINHNHLQQQRLSNFKAKEGQRLSLSIVQQSMMLNKKLNHLEIRRRRNSNEKLLLSQRSSELSTKRERSESLKKQRLQQIQAKYFSLKQQDLERKNSHVQKVITEVKTAKLQEKVINSLSNIETLMVNKLANTQQKLRVLKNSEKHDVLEFLKRDDSRGSKQSKSKSRIGNPKLKNVHSIPAEALSKRQPQM